jgi:hypothetical protein
MPSKKNLTTVRDQSPPLGDGGKAYWQKWYVAVIGFLLVQVVLYFLITIYFQ